MAEITVSKLAETVGKPVEDMLAQMKEAGLPHQSADELVSDDDKKTLLEHLKGGQKGDVGEPRKITLKRKTQTTLKSAAKKTVNVEVRKKRTFVKRSPADIEAEAKAAQARAEEEDNAEQARIAEAEAAEAAQLAEQKARRAAEEAEKAEKAELEAKAEQDPSDPEVMRQLAAIKRKEKERVEAQAHEDLLKAKAEEKAKEEQKVVDAAEKRSQTAQAGKQKTVETVETVDVAPKEPVTAKPSKKKRTGKADDDDKLKVRTLKDGKRKSGSHNIQVQLTEDGEYEEEIRPARRKLKRLDLKQQAFEKPTEKIVHEVELSETITVGDLAQRMSVKAGEVIKVLLNMGVMATVNQALDQDTAILVVEEMGHKYKLVSETALEDNLLEGLGKQEGTLEPRAPVVTVMGHVDHGKTSLLDYIRKSKVASGEAGGITQHIGAYHVNTDRGMVTFLDTPGHAAFTAMRARGAQTTDVIILVVAADDGMMPQTQEAIEHARAANVPFVVAINKMDKPEADPERVRNELATKDVISEEWGGDIQFVPVSAHTGEGIDNLLEAVLLQSELLELKAARDIPARGLVIESRLDKGRGAVATVLVQTGVLRAGDIVLAGESFGRVRAMVDETGKQIKEAGPSLPAEILGLNGTPEAGDEFFVVESEKQAREVAEQRNQRAREARLARQQAAKLENLFESMGSEQRQSLNIVLKSDVRGSLEAIQGALADIGNDEVEVNVVSAGVGGITESDVNLAITAEAVVFGFNVRAETAAKSLVEKEGVDLRYYSVIYNLIDDVKQALGGMLSPEFREHIVGIAEVRDIFKSPKFGQVAGCMVLEGTVHRNKPIRVLRDNVVIFEGELESLRRFKDDVNEVRSGTECGIGVKNYLDVRVGDKIEVFDRQEVARSL